MGVLARLFASTPTPPPTPDEAEQVVARLRKFRRALTGWRVTNSDDTDLQGALAEAIDLIERQRASHPSRATGDDSAKEGAE